MAVVDFFTEEIAQIFAECLIIKKSKEIRLIGEIKNQSVKSGKNKIRAILPSQEKSW
jgi:hypothetical protein